MQKNTLYPKKVHNNWQNKNMKKHILYGIQFSKFQ